MDREPAPTESQPAVAPPQAQVTEDTAQHPRGAPTVHHASREGLNVVAVSPASSSVEQQALPTAATSDGRHAIPRSHENPFDPTPAPPPRSRDGHGRASGRYQHLSSTNGPPRSRSGSALDWIIPVEEKDKSHKRRTVGERLQPTIENAEKERQKYASKALLTGYALNVAIGMQVFLGALTTGLAAAVKDAKQAQLSTAVLGGLATIVASYLARARGSGEPELSTGRVKDLEYFLRDCRAFQIDHAHEYAIHGDHLDRRLEELRRKLEEMLGNATDAPRG